MARGSPIQVGIALVFVFVISCAQADEKCRSGCQGAPQTFKYQDGTTYKYNFDSKVEITLSSAEGQKTVTEIKGQVLLTQQPQCNQILRVQNVQVIGNDGKKYSNIPDIEKPVRLNYHDGHLEDSICIVPGDTQNSLNIKRAIASIFQANLKNGHETDVFGLCPTEVNHHKEGNVVVVQKSRNLNRCAYRENIRQDFLATAFNLNSEIKSSPILNADYNAKLRIKNGILDQAVVTENYLYVPFSVGNKGAKASVETTLKYVGTGRDGAQAKVSLPRSIIFEDPHPINSPTSNVNSILAAVKETAKTIDVTVSDKTAKEFVNLIKILRVSSKNDLLAVYNQVRAGVGFSDKLAAKKIFLDALLRAGNGDNVEVAVELLKNKELNPIEQRLVYLGLSFVRHPTESALVAATSLLNQPNLPREAYLGIGTLAGRHCRQHSCKNVDAVNKLTQKLVQKLGSGKADNREQENDIIFVLKALANIGQLSDNILGKITAIAQDKKTSNRLRVAALETYAADACKDKLRDSALNILKDIQQDSEVRIKAYLALAQCPNAKVGGAIKQLLTTEESYQVGGFIVSHIRNLRASANPDKELAKQHLGMINLPKKFPVDPRKWSTNAEFSYSIDTLGIAESVESNVIYSQSSFLPRSTSLNLTTEIFGHNFNFLDIELRQENLDRLLEHYLGPKGLLRSHSLQEIWKTNSETAQQFINKLTEGVKRSLRARRDVSKAEIENIGKQVQIKTNDLNKDLDLDLSVRAFGSELLFVNINDDVKKFTPDAIIKQIVDGLNQGLDKLKHFEETFRSNLLFLDIELAYPTSAGFPLRLGVEGSSNIQVKAAGSIDVRALLAQDATVKVSLIPSANIEVAGRLTIDALLLENGLKVISNLHTATGGDLVVDLNSKGVDVKFSLPVEKQELISVTHEIVFHTRELGAPEHNTPIKFSQNKEFSICLDQLSPFIGLTFCGELEGPNLSGKHVPVLPFPLSGDGKASVTIEREDISLYHYKHVVYNSADKIGGEIIAEALAKNGQQKVSLQIEGFLAPEKYFKATLKSPITTASVEGKITTNNKENSASLRFLENNNEYFGKIGFSVEGSPSRSIFKPILLYKTPQQGGVQTPAHRVEGQVIVEQNGPNTKYIFDQVKLIIPNKKTVTINGNLGREPETVYTDLTLTDGQNSGTLKGRLQANPNLIKYNVEIKNSLNPTANVHLKGELSRRGEETKHFFQVIHGQDLSSKTNILTVDNFLKYRNKGPEDFLLETKNKVTYPLFGVNAKLDFELEPKAVGYDIDVQYNDVKLGSELEWKHDKKQEGVEYEGEFEVWGLNNRLELKVKRKIAGGQSHIENSLEVNGKKLEVNGKVKHNIKPQDVDFAADLVIKTPTHNSPFKVVSVLRLNANEIDASNKISSGGTVYVDVFLKANKGGNANGAIKVNLKDQLVVNGQIKANKGNGNGEIVIELPSVGRTAKADTTFTIHEPNYNVVINIYPIFNQDPSKKITFSTQTRATPQSIDSKNLVDIIGHKLAVNIKGNQQGDLTNGKINGEVDVTLPNDNYVAARLNRDFRTANNVINGNFLVSLEHRSNKNTPGGKVTLTGQARNTNSQEQVYDLTYTLTAENGNGKALNVDLAVKKTPKQEDGSTTTTISNKISGSVVSSPVESSIKFHCSPRSHTYEITSNCARHGNLEVKGRVDTNEDHAPVSGDISIDLKSTSKILKSLKVNGAGSVNKGDQVAVKGQGSFYLDTPEKVLVDVSGNGEVKASDKEGRIKGSVKSGQLDPVSIDVGYSRSEDNENQKLQGDISAHYGKGQTIKGDVTLIRLPKHEYKIDASLHTPTDKYRSNRLQVHTKRSEDNTHHESSVILTSDGQVWTANTDLLLSELSPSIDIQVKHPDGKRCQLAAKINKVSDRQFDASLKIINEPKEFLWEGDIDANIESVDDFHVKISAHSPALKLDKFVIEAQNKPAKSGRRIQVTAKSANKSILSGSTSYTAREERGKLIIEGSGSFKVKEETQSANFKYIRQNLEQDKNGETGIEISFDAGLGNKAIDAELKITNKQFRISNSYCEEKKQCAHVEIDAKTSIDDITQFNQEIEISVDLRKLGLSHEFGLKAVTNRKGYILDHTVDVHFQSQENSKYQYSIYLHPKEAGVSLTTPRRIISFEINVNAPPTLLKDGGKVSGEVVLYLDKKHQPNQKSALVGWLSVNPRDYSLDGEVKFTNPALRRPLSATINSNVAVGKQKSGRKGITTTIVLDVFAQPNQKIIANIHQQLPDLNNDKVFEAGSSIEIKSVGLNIDIRGEDTYYISRETYTYKQHNTLKIHIGNSKCDSTYNLEVSPKQIQVLVRLANIELFKAISQLQLNKDVQVVNTDVSAYGLKPLTSHLEVKNWNTVKFSVAKKESPNDKLVVNSGLIIGQIADFRAEIIKGGAPHELLHATVKLDEANFLKSDYGIQSQHIQELLFKPVKAEISNYVNELRNAASELTRHAQNDLKEIGEVAKRAAPNLGPLKQYYADELLKIKDEIASDKTIRQISEFLHNVIAAVSQSFGEIYRNFSELVENIARSVQASFSKIIEAVDKELLPQLKEIADKLLHLAADIVDRVSDIVLTYLSKLTQLVEKFQPELKQLGAIIGELTQDIGRVLIKAYDSIRTILFEQWNYVYNEIKAFPFFTQVKAEFENFIEKGIPNKEALISTVKDVFATLKDVAPTQELKVLIDTISQYVNQKLTNQKVDDIAALEKILSAALDAVKQIVDLVIKREETPDLQKFQWPLPANIINKLPKIVGAKFSPVTYWLRGDIPDVSVFILSLINKPRNWIPPFPLYGVIAQGQHIFTFDGKHLTFPGKCNYLIARDAVDGNFTVIGTYENGLLTAITLSDGPDSITLKNNGRVLLNNAVTELPARKPNIAAYRDYEKITLVSTAGVQVICGPQLFVCSVTLSGFYHGKVRGLLGNGNNDPYDDFTLANGKIVTTESDFGNSYKTNAGCAAVQAVPHTHGHHAAPTCDKLFGWESSLRYCYLFVNPENFKTACQHGVATGVKDSEFAAAVAYVAACNRHNIPISVPAEFVQCFNNEKPVDVGEKFSVKIPQKAADIVLLVDTTKKNEPVYKEYIQPLVQQLTNELHSKGIDDVEFHLVTYGGDNQWPSHVTVNGKLTFKGKLPNTKFSETHKEERLQTGVKCVDNFLQLLQDIKRDADLALGLDLQAQTYSEGFQYPFRAHAVKSIIAVTGNPCEVGRLYSLQVVRTLLYRDKNIHLNLITPFEKFHAKDAKHTKEVVGFDSENVFTLAQSKNKPKGGAELHKDLEYEDYCVDFTIQNDGNVFVLDNFLQTKGAARKQFVQITSHNIVDQLTGIEQGVDCECKLVTPFTARNVCHVVHVKERAQAKKTKS